MAFQFPWTNLHELNLDWFLSKFKQFTNNYLETTATAESVPYNAQPSVTVTGGELDDDTDIVNPFNFHFKIPAGMGILSLTITYNVTDDDIEPISGWTTSKPSVNPGQYLWIKQTIILQNGIGQSYTYFVYYPVDGTTPTIDIDAYPTENSPNAVSSGGVWTDINILKSTTENNIAWVENTTTASISYIPGDYVIINGELCKITTNVTAGSTLIEDTNYIVIGGNGGLCNDLNNITQYYYTSTSFPTSSSDTIRNLISAAIARTVANLSSGFSHISFSYSGHSWGGDVYVFICDYVGATAYTCSGIINIMNGTSSSPAGESYIFTARWTKSTSTLTGLKMSNAISLT